MDFYNEFYQLIFQLKTICLLWHEKLVSVKSFPDFFMFRSEICDLSQVSISFSDDSLNILEALSANLGSCERF